MNSEIFLQHPSIIAVITYGSKNRGDYDCNSDYDLLVLCEDITIRETEILRTQLFKKIKIDNLSISIYRQKDFILMLKKGSLFAWHLKLEGSVVYQLHEIEIFDEIKPYKELKSDIQLYSILFDECSKSLELLGMNEFDLATLFTISRNCCMVLCYKFGKPSFGRTSVYYTLKEILGSNLLLTEENYLLLSRWKLSYERGMAPPPYPNNLYKILFQIKSLLILGKEETEK